MKALSTETLVINYLMNLSDEELLNLLLYIEGLILVKKNRTKLSHPELKYMFSLYNEIFHATETGIHCGSCRQTVYEGLSKLIKYINDEFERRKPL